MKSGMKPGTVRRAWSPEDDATLIRLYMTGVDRRIIAETLGRQINVLAHRVQTLADNGLLQPRRSQQPMFTVDEADAQRSRDKMFVRAMAKAFMRGDHLPKTRAA